MSKRLFLLMAAVFFIRAAKAQACSRRGYLGPQAPVPTAAQTVFRPEIPRAWDEARLAEWATPLAGIQRASDSHLVHRKSWMLSCPGGAFLPSCLCREPLHRL